MSVVGADAVRRAPLLLRVRCLPPIPCRDDEKPSPDEAVNGSNSFASAHLSFVCEIVLRRSFGVGEPTKVARKHLSQVHTRSEAHPPASWKWIVLIGGLGLLVICLNAALFLLVQITRCQGRGSGWNSRYHASPRTAFDCIRPVKLNAAMQRPSKGSQKFKIRRTVVKPIFLTVYTTQQ
jgi:hypothetical protein